MGASHLLNDETPLRPRPAMNFPIRQCANIKLWRLQTKPTIIPHAQTRPKTDFTGSCLTIPGLEGTRLFVNPDLCLDVAALWTSSGCNCPKFKVKTNRENEKVICPHRFVHMYRFLPFPLQLPTVIQTETERWKSNHHLDNEAFTRAELRNVTAWTLSTVRGEKRCCSTRLRPDRFRPLLIK